MKNNIGTITIRHKNGISILIIAASISLGIYIGRLQIRNEVDKANGKIRVLNSIFETVTKIVNKTEE